MIVNNQSDTLNEILEKVESIDTFNNGKQTTLFKTEPEFDNLLSKLQNMFYASRIEPALGVSLHNLTLQAMQEDKWIQLNFKEEQSINELPFNSLLFKVENTFGLNLTRKYNNLYDGRCIYVVLNDIFELENLI